MTRKKASRPRKQTSSRVSTLAASLLRRAQLWADEGYDSMPVSLRELKTLCASLVSQDETRGQR